MIQQASTFDTKDLKLPMTFIMTGLLFFIVSQIILLNTTHSLSLSIARIPTVWAAVHLLILGFAVMVTMGAMYQLVPVAMQVQIYSVRLGHIQFFIYAIGVLGIGWGFLDFSPARLVFFSLITIVGILLFEINIWLSMRGAKKTEIGLAIKLSLTYFILTILLGAWLAIDFLFPHLQLWHDRLLYIHIIFGTIGWFTLVIIGFSYKLIPMFTLSHGYETKLPQYTIHFINGGIISIVFQQVTRFNVFLWLGYGLIIVGMLLFIEQIRIILKNRLKKKLDLGVKVALCAWPFSIILVLFVAILGLVLDKAIPITAIVYIVLSCWIAMSILGYLFKILPFLWWTYRYSETIGKKKVPSLKEMTNENLGKWIFLLFGLSILTNILAMLFHLSTTLYVSQLVLVFVSLLYFFEMIKILTK